MSFWKRRALCKFTLSDHALLVERGRYGAAGVPREQRFRETCRALGQETCEDERHALDACPRFQSERENALRIIRNLGMLNEEYSFWMQVK